MNIGIITPGFSADENDWAIPVQQHLASEMADFANVRVISLRYPHTRIPYQIGKVQIYPLGYGAWTRRLQRLRMWWHARRFIEKLHREKPFDVLHALWADETGFIAGWVGNKLNIPVVVTVSGGETVGLPDIAYGLQLHRFSRWTVKNALKRADAITVGCKYSQRLTERIVPQTVTPTHIVPLGINPDFFYPKVPIARNRHLIHVASLIDVKDQTTLLKAQAHLNNMTLDIIGEGPKLEYLQNLAQELGIHERVRFLGNIPHPDLVQHYQQASLNVLTSRHEGFGMVVIEAAACGVPTIGTDVGILPDAPDIGITVPTENHQLLAEEIDKVLSDPKRLQSLQQSAIEAVNEKYTIQNTVSQLLELYGSLQP